MDKFLSKKITRVSFILAICVILLHSTNTITYTFAKYNPFRLLEEYLATLFEIAVPTFFVISGFLFYRNADSLQSVGNKCKKRIFTLLIPYLIFNVIYTIYFMSVYNIPGLKEHFNNAYRGTLTLKTILRGVFLAEFSGILWYVRNLIVLTVISPIIFYSLKIKPISFIIAFGLFITFLLNISIPKMTYIQFSSWFWYYLGAVFAVNIKSFSKFSTKINLIFLLGGIIFTLLLFILSDNLISINLSGKVYSLTYNLILTAMIICFWFAFDLLVTEKTIKFEKLSFFIYCLHSLILETIQKTIFIVGGNNMLVAVFDYIVSPTLTFGIICVIALFLNRFLPKIFKIVSGGRTLNTTYENKIQNQ